MTAGSSISKTANGLCLTIGMTLLLSSDGTNYYSSNRLRSASPVDDGTYFPSTCTIDVTGWSYVGEKIGGSSVLTCPQRRALLAGIKNLPAIQPQRLLPNAAAGDRLPATR